MAPIGSTSSVTGVGDSATTLAVLRPPWGYVTRQIYLGGQVFLERIERLVRGKSVAHVPTAQATPTRLSPGAILLQYSAGP